MSKPSVREGFAARLKSERIRLGLTQEQFAVLGGVGRFSQSLYEAGVRAPSGDYLLGVADHGVSLDYLFNGRSSQTAQKALLLTAFRAVDRAFPGEAGNPETLDDRAKHFMLLVDSLTEIHVD